MIGSVGELWDKIESLLAPFPRNTGRFIGDNESTYEKIIKHVFAKDTPDQHLLDYMIQNIQDVVADCGDKQLHVRIYPEIKIYEDSKYCYCRLQWIE